MSNSMENLQVNKKKGIADVVWVIDKTTSMKNCFEEMKKNIHLMFDEIEKNNLESANGQGLNVRQRIVAFADLTVQSDPDPKLVGDNPFVEDVDEIIKQLDSIEVLDYVGGDQPESALDGLFVAAVNSDWRPLYESQRIIVLLTDADTKDMEPSTVGENNPTDVDFLIQKLNEGRIKLFLYGPNSAKYKEIADRTSTIIYEQLGAPEDVKVYEGLKTVKWDNVMELLIKTISQQSEVI